MKNWISVNRQNVRATLQSVDSAWKHDMAALTLTEDEIAGLKTATLDFGRKLKAKTRRFMGAK